MLAAISVLFLLAAPGVGAVVSVQTNTADAPQEFAGQARQVCGALLVRLVEEGYIVSPRPSDAQIRIALRHASAGWSIEMTGSGRREYHVDNGPLAVISLEILHRAVIAIEASEDTVRELPAITGRSVALEVSADQSDPLARRVHEEVALQLSDSGLFLVPRSLRHDRTVCVTLGPAAIAISTSRASERCGQPILEITRHDRSDEEVIRRVGQQIANLARHRDGESSELGASGAGTASPDRWQPTASWRWRTGLSGGGLFREGGADPIVLASGELLASSRWAARLHGGVVWSNGGGSLSIVEWQLQMGPTFIAPFGSSSALALGVMGGVLVHRYFFDAADQGSRVNWNVSMPMAVSHRFGPVVELALTLLPGLAGPPRDHEISGKPAWHRSVYYVGLMAGLGASL
jgi:hypothetical protein